MERRKFLLFSGIGLATAAGCETDSQAPNPVEVLDNTIERTIASTETADLRQTKLVLRGYALISYTLGGRLLFLPYPGMRILSVAIIASGIVARLVIEYIDDELIRRQVEEELTNEVRAQLESQGYVEFKTESGVTEKVQLSPTQY